MSKTTKMLIDEINKLIDRVKVLENQKLPTGVKNLLCKKCEGAGQVDRERHSFTNLLQHVNPAATKMECDSCQGFGVDMDFMHKVIMAEMESRDENEFELMKHKAEQLDEMANAAALPKKENPCKEVPIPDLCNARAGYHTPDCTCGALTVQEYLTAFRRGYLPANYRVIWAVQP